MGFPRTVVISILFAFSCKATARIQDLQFKITNAEEEVRSLQLKHEFELEVEKKAKKCLQREKDSLENELNISKQEVMALKSTVAKMTADSLGITTELQATKVRFVLFIIYFRYNARLLHYSLFCFPL